MSESSGIGRDSYSSQTHPAGGNTESYERIAASFVGSQLEYPECSILASDTANDVVREFHRDIQQGNARTIELAVKDGDIGYSLAGKAVFLRQAFESGAEKVASTGYSSGPTGHTVDFALVQAHDARRFSKRAGEGTQDIHLMAIARGNLALPVVRFVPLIGAADANNPSALYCDTLQFWGEQPGEELNVENIYGWGQDDVGSRFDTVQQLGELIAGRISKEDREKLIASLKIDSRIGSSFGHTTPERERLLRNVMSIDKTQTHDIVIQNVPWGKVASTDVAASTTVQVDKERPDQRRVTVLMHPASQDAERWRHAEETYVIHSQGQIVCVKDEKSREVTLDDNQEIEKLMTLIPEAGASTETSPGKHSTLGLIGLRRHVKAVYIGPAVAGAVAAEVLLVSLGQVDTLGEAALPSGVIGGGVVGLGVLASYAKERRAEKVRRRLDTTNSIKKAHHSPGTRSILSVDQSLPYPERLEQRKAKKALAVRMQRRGLRKSMSPLEWSLYRHTEHLQSQHAERRNRRSNKR